MVKLGKKYLCDGNPMYLDDVDSLELKKKGIYEPETTYLMKSIIKPTDVCLDIGANVGYYSIIMGKLAKSVLAFEPDPDNFKILESNIKLNKLANVGAWNYAISNTTGYIDLYKCTFNKGMHRIYPSKWCEGGTIKVRSMILDQFVNRCEFIKMDVEGSEYLALKGMQKLIQSNKPTIIMEFHPPSIEEAGIQPYQIEQFLTANAYRFRLIPHESNINFTLKDILSNNYSISYNELEHITRNSPGRSILCFHESSKLLIQ